MSGQKDGVMAGASAPEGACGLGPDECYYCRGTGEDPELHLSVEQKANLDAQQIGPGGCPRCRPEVASPGAIGFFKANEPEGAAPTGREPEADASKTWTVYVCDCGAHGFAPECDNPIEGHPRELSSEHRVEVVPASELEASRSRCLELEGALREAVMAWEAEYGGNWEPPGWLMIARSVLAPVAREGERPDEG